MKTLLILGGISGFLFVAIGAFGAHALQPRLESYGLKAQYETGVQYHMIHTVAILVIAILMRYFQASGLLYGAGWAMFIGIILFSGSLYAMGVTGIRPLGAITPIGGVAFLTGWALMVIAVIQEG
ncbi:DUF423 domain-containing protein [Texcoconibacillus texcoconensis]|uniref:Uncharacterized membrane protein YgdD (TMEM256/DUF423 family) n=1 Tax=Texcoconibacillus texcoconensis TaxID=1095777 RepID=A0A840QS81_9BACI|nr:DUF423 domain-containing protein [Texcoconibacillus texcoconensis]MBB5174137.1 uncharacterized membrane protein YgdD (TMEM256/DUF423 family) [Texcoconibacillus texcoconensis]